MQSGGKNPTPEDRYLSRTAVCPWQQGGKRRVLLLQGRLKPHTPDWQPPGKLGKPNPKEESSRSQKHRARRNFSLRNMEHSKTLTLQGKEPFWLVSGISCSLDAFSRLNVSDLHFALDRPHTATEPAATRMIRSSGEESAQAKTHSLAWSCDSSAAQHHEPTARDEQCPLRARNRQREGELVPYHMERPFQGHNTSKAEQ